MNNSEEREWQHKELLQRQAKPKEDRFYEFRAAKIKRDKLRLTKEEKNDE